MLRAAMAALSACDIRPWSFVVCREIKWFDAPCAIVVCGKWHNSLCLPDAVRFPVKGRHVCKFMLEENNIVKCYHPGHDVTEIIELKCRF